MEHCGATKVAERLFLTAAHCVVAQEQFTIKSDFWAGNTMQIASMGRKDKKISLTAMRVVVVQDYAKTLLDKHLDATVPTKRLSGKDFDLVTDLAVFEVKELTPELTIYPLRKDPVKVTEQVTVMGWGRRYKDTSGTFIVEGPTSDLHTAQVVIDRADADKTTFSFKNEVNEYHEISLSLAPGDSGSGAFSWVKPKFGKGSWQISGVNSYESSGLRSHLAKVHQHASPCLQSLITHGSLLDQSENLVLAPNQEIPTICAR
jgi:hypothetical protein